MVTITRRQSRRQQAGNPSLLPHKHLPPPSLLGALLLQTPLRHCHRPARPHQGRIQSLLPPRPSNREPRPSPTARTFKHSLLHIRARPSRRGGTLSAAALEPAAAVHARNARHASWSCRRSNRPAEGASRNASTRSRSEGPAAAVAAAGAASWSSSHRRSARSGWTPRRASRPASSTTIRAR